MRSARSSQMGRQGFTLVELLVAVGIFMFGFTAVYSMFLFGARQRALADSISMSAFASASISAEIRLFAGRDGDNVTAADYNGDGFAQNGAEADFSRYLDLPRVFYRLNNCRSLGGNGEVNAFTGELLIYISPGTSLEWQDLVRRHRIIPDGEDTFDPNRNIPPQEIIDALLPTGRLQRYPLVVHRLRD